MSATEIVRRMLDERGVEWTAPNSILRDTMTCWTAGGFYYEAFEVPEPDGTFLLTAAHQDDLTPSQAIAATLGRGMLTSDDVRDLIERHSDASGGNGRDFHNGAYVAIANELNATLGQGTCHLKPWEMERDTGFYDCMECACGYVADVADWAEWHFCPNCGRRVTEVDE